MAMAAVRILPPLDLKSSTLEAENSRPTLVKETSTVGDLISFTDRGPRRESPLKRRRKSSGDLDIYATPRRKSIQRQNSLKDLPFVRRKRSSSTPPDDPSPEELATYRTRRRQSRSDAMLNVLREDLEKIPRLQSLRRFSSQTSVEEGGPFSDSDGDDNATFTNRRHSRRTSSVFRSESRKSDSSMESVSGNALSEHELRKLRMLYTLNRMDGKQTAADRKKSIDSTGEVAVLEASFIKGRKRGSIATHVLMKARSRRSNADTGKSKANVVIPDNPSPTKKSEAEELAEAQKEKTQKFFQLLKKNEVKQSGIVTAREPETTPIREESPKDILQTFRRKLRRKKIKPIQVFRKRAKFLVLLLRAWKIHSNNINEILVDNNESLEMITRGNQADLMFDVTTYKASKEAAISPEVKRILMKKPKTRTEEEQYYVQIFLRNYKSVAEYPVKMQKLIAQRSWIESYDMKRVIVREGHVPVCFYFILSGSAIVSTMEDGVPKTVMFLGRGDSFGDIAILNNSRRETTVISREKIELLVMSDNDFVDIFMSGGIRDPNDPFLKSINFLSEWPREKMIDNPKKCIFSYFKRGTILVNDSNKSDWIFVIKSGSASVLKKLQAVDVKRKPKKKKVLDFRDQVLAVMKHETYLSHEEQMSLMYEEEKRSLEDQNLHVRFFALPEINVATNDSYNELRQMKEEYMNANTITRALGALEKMADDGVDMKSETGASGSMTDASTRKAQSLRRKSVANAVLKGPFIKGSSSYGREASFHSGTSHRGLESRGTQNSRNSRRSSVQNHEATQSDKEVDQMKKKVDDWQEMSLPSMAASPINDLTIRPTESQPIFVEVQALTKGQVFGLAEMLYDNQPNFSLVSNGAECIMIEKKFFMENASQWLMVHLRETTYPYPSNEALQESLESHLRWNSHKKFELNKLLREVQYKRSDANDSRSTLRLPAIHT